MGLIWYYYRLIELSNKRMKAKEKWSLNNSQF